MKIKNVSGIDFENKSDEELYVKQLRCPNLLSIDFNKNLFVDAIPNFLKQDNVNFLEIGCGWGRNAQFFKELTNVKYWGFDPSATSRKYFEAQNLPKDRFYIGAEIDEEILSNKYDVIFSSYVLQHIGWPDEKEFTVTAILETLIPQLKDDGVMIFYELHSGQNGWCIKRFRDWLKISFNIIDHGCVSLDTNNDCHELLIAKRIKK